MTNPLIEQARLLDFAAIAPEHVTPALDVLLKDAHEALEKACAAQPASWETTVDPLETALTRLARAWGAVGHLMGVMDSPALRETFNANLPRVAQFYIALSQNEALFARYKEIAAGAGFKTLDALKRRVIDHELRDFRLSGAELAPGPKARLKALEEESSRLSQKFSENLLDATNAFALDIKDRSELDGIPEDICETYAEAARAAGVEGWRITLQIPSYLPVMQYAASRALRERLYRAYSTRASELDNPARDNTPVIARLLDIRYEQAHLLGMKDYAEVSLATKMARKPERVTAFLEQLARSARPKALADYAELEAFARDKLGIESLQPWDTAWASEKLRRAKYNYSGQEVRRYFTLPAVFQGMFRMVENLFDIRIRPDSAPVWHPDVQFWRISDKSGRLIAQFYTDLYARASKRGGAWMDNDSTYAVLPDGSVRTPTAYLVCNFQKPVGDKPATLTHDDVTTLFHEFGHGLHHMLSRVGVAQLSGINGFEWDAVEMPSQFMENWAWNFDIVETLSAHVETGEKLPRDLFDRMLAAKNFQSGMFCVRQLEFALFDMRIHGDPESSHAADFQKVLDDVRREVAVTPSAPFNRFAQSFSHIFAGGYAAGYYSYKWAEVLSADAFSAFEEEGLFNKATGRRWLDEVISRGASRDAMESFVAFRGREPSIEPLLRHTGIIG